MYTFLLALLILDSVILVAAVLMQAAKGGGLAASFGGVSTAADAFIGSRQAGDFLTKLTWWGAGVFLALAFVLQLISIRPQTPRSILDQPGTVPQTQTSPPPPTTNPVVPLTPAEKAPPPSGEKKNP